MNSMLKLLNDLLGMTAYSEGISSMCEDDFKETVALLLTLIKNNDANSEKACSILINITAEEKGSEWFLALNPIRFNTNELITPVSFLLECILDDGFSFRDPCCIILSNVSRSTHVSKVLDHLPNLQIALENIIRCLLRLNSSRCELHYLSTIVSNLSQLSDVRKILLDPTNLFSNFQKLIPYINYQESTICRRSIVATFRNLCFDFDQHAHLLSEEVGLIPSLLLPLIGGEELAEEEMDKLPLSLQYLGHEKRREPETDIRQMLLDSLQLLCSTRLGREAMRKCNAYVVLRELHKWERDTKCLWTCENVVNLLIRTEEEIGVDNLNDVEIPKDVENNFVKVDKEFSNDSE